MRAGSTTHALAFTCDGAYAEPALLALFSALCAWGSARPTGSSPPRLHCHFIMPAQTAAAVTSGVGAHIRAFGEAWPWFTATLNRPHLPRAMAENPDKPKSEALFYRLYFADFLPISVRRVFYLDPDVLVLGDLSSLFARADTLVADKPFAAAADDGLTRRVRRALGPLGRARNALGVLGMGESAGRRLVRVLGERAARRYANSGVVLFDLAQWRAWDCAAQLDRLGDIGALAYRDQDALNLIAHRLGFDIPTLPTAVNLQSYAQAPTQARAANPLVIKHYVGPRKPWLASAKGDKPQRLAWHRLYWQWQADFARFRRDHQLTGLTQT